MRYIWQSGKKRRVMHLMRFTTSGEGTMASVCGATHLFDRSINAPFALGRRVCKRCLKGASLTMNRG